jgi:hypothetical protein
MINFKQKEIISPIKFNNSNKLLKQGNLLDSHANNTSQNSKF